MKMLVSILVAFISLHIQAQYADHLTKKSAIYIVRHAEKGNGNDPVLTTEGNTRAGDLMRILQNKKISRIYVTQFKRTQNTGDSLRLQFDIDTVQVNADTSCNELFSAIEQHKDWNKPILIITHSNIIQKIIYKLGVTDFPQQNIPEKEFDNLYKVSLQNKKPVLNHTKYGKPSAASAKMMEQ